MRTGFPCVLQHEARCQTPHLFPQLVEPVADLQDSEFQLLGSTLGLPALLKC